MPQDHPPLPAVANRLLCDVTDVQVLRLVEEIHVEVGVHAEFPGQPKDDVDLREARRCRCTDSRR